MTNSKDYKIAYYLAWCGAEALHQFENKNQYDKARGLLDQIAKLHMHGKELHPAYAAIVSDYYVFEKDQREAFQEIMRRF